MVHVPSTAQLNPYNSELYTQVGNVAGMNSSHLLPCYELRSGGQSQGSGLVEVYREKVQGYAWSCLLTRGEGGRQDRSTWTPDPFRNMAVFIRLS